MADQPILSQSHGIPLNPAERKPRRPHRAHRISLDTTNPCEESVDGAAHQSERAAQLGFTAAFQRELRDFERTRERLKKRWMPSRHERRLARLRVHMLRPPESLVARDGNSAVDTRQGHLQRLHALGRKAADAWLVDYQASRPVR